MNLPIAALAYCALGVVLALLAIAALSPRSFGPFRALAGMGGMIVTLIVPQTLIFGLIVAALFSRFGALEHPLGLLGLALHGGAWLTLTVLQIRMNRALPMLDGKQVRDEALPFGESPPVPWRAAWSPALLLRTKTLSTAKIEKSVVFRTVAGRKLLLDVYRPCGEHTPRPAIVYVHGGGWIAGSRRQSRFLCAELAALGHPVFALSYRFAPFVRPRDIVEDCKAGLAWVRARQQSYGASDETYVIGGSAGGHLAAMLALTPNQPRFQQGFEDADTSVHGAVIFYGVSDLSGHFGDRPDLMFGLYLQRLVFRTQFTIDPESFRELEPLAWASKDAPPMLFVHGTTDGVVPIEHSRLIVQKLREAGAPQVHLLEVPFAHHAFEVLPTVLHQRVVRVVGAWLRALARST